MLFRDLGLRLCPPPYLDLQKKSYLIYLISNEYAETVEYWWGICGIPNFGVSMIKYSQKKKRKCGTVDR